VATPRTGAKSRLTTSLRLVTGIDGKRRRLTLEGRMRDREIFSAGGVAPSIGLLQGDLPLASSKNYYGG